MNLNTSDSHWTHVHLACMDIGWNVVSSKTEQHCLKLSQNVGWPMHDLSYMRRVIHKYKRLEYTKLYSEHRQWWISTSIHVFYHQYTCILSPVYMYFITSIHTKLFNLFCTYLNGNDMKWIIFEILQMSFLLYVKRHSDIEKRKQYTVDPPLSGPHFWKWLILEYFSASVC